MVIIEAAMTESQLAVSDLKLSLQQDKSAVLTSLPDESGGRHACTHALHACFAQHAGSSSLLEHASDPRGCWSSTQHKQIHCNRWGKESMADENTNVACSWGQCSAAGNERSGPEASLGEQPAQHQGGLGRVDAPLCCGAAEGVPQPCPQGYPPPGSGASLQLHTSCASNCMLLQHP